jgi:hydroxymethylbilane synthase
MLIGARSSPLSRAQVAELQKELNLSFDTLFIETHGDLDKNTSLRSLDKTDFFTRELDQLLLSHQIDAAIHSAKDLPDPLPSGLKLAYLSKGLTSCDSLVFTHYPPTRIATSSLRREESVRALFPNAAFIDIRGTIAERLARLEQDIDGVVIAECALLRLHLTHLPRLILPGPTAPLQGKLALITRDEPCNFI